MEEKTKVDSYLKEMFRRVGEKYPNKKLTDQKDWYTKKTWTKKEEDSFRDWMKKRMKRDFPGLPSSRIKREVSGFLLMWGWRCED